MRKLLPLPFILLAACTHVDAGNVGVQIDSCSGGGVQETPVEVGYHTTGPCTTIVEFPVYQQTLVLTKASTEGEAHDQSINVTSSEGLPISVDSSLSFVIEGPKAPHIYKKFRKDLSSIGAIFLRQSIREGLQETFAKYTAQQLYSDKKEIARAEVQGFLTKRIGADGFNVTQFTINEIRVPQEVLNAISSKVSMTQEAQRAQQAVAKAEAEGRQRVAVAEADAQAIKLKADAEAYANEKIARSLSAVLVQYKAVGHWDGKLPTYSGGSGGGLSFLLPSNTEHEGKK